MQLAERLYTQGFISWTTLFGNQCRLSFFFLVDVSINAIQIGATFGAFSAISRFVNDLLEDPQTLPLIFLIQDIYDVYTPLPSDVIVQLSKVTKLPKNGVDDHWTLTNNINDFSRIL
ncbi:hypothetical protein Lser_V15G06224 [Lactuca serriola]